MIALGGLGGFVAVGLVVVGGGKGDQEMQGVSLEFSEADRAGEQVNAGDAAEVRDHDDELTAAGRSDDLLNRLLEPALLEAQARLDAIGNGEAAQLGELAQRRRRVK